MDSSRKRSNFSANSKRTSPAGVSSTDLAERSSNLARYACSSWRICALTADCERNTFCPAREKLFSLATYTKVASWSKSMGKSLDEDYRRIVVPGAALNLLSLGMHSSLRNGRDFGREGKLTLAEPCKDWLPSIFHGSLQIKRLKTP